MARPIPYRQDLDEAVLDRVDEVIHMPMPTLTERTRLAGQYFEAYLHHDAPVSCLVSGVKDGSARGAQDGRSVPPPSARPETEGDAIPPSPSVSASPETALSPPYEVDKRVSVFGTAEAVSKDDRSSFAADSKKSRLLSIILGLFVGRQQTAEGGPRTKPQRCASGAHHFDPADRRGLFLGRVPRNGLGGTTRGVERRKGGARGGGVVVRLNQGFSDKAAGLMAMLAVRSEGFYGRDMARFFLSVQVSL